MTAPFVLTASGRAMDMLDPDPGAVALSDVAGQLAKICRFTGATGGHYSIAQHSVLVADMLPVKGGGLPDYHVKVAGLLHDAHEIYTGDISSPMQRAIQRLIDATQLHTHIDPIAMIQCELDKAVWWAFGLCGSVNHDIDVTLPEAARALIDMADQIAFATEIRDLMPPMVDGRSWGELPRDDRIPPITPLAWPAAETLFLNRARDLAGRAGLSGGAWER